MSLGEESSVSVSRQDERFRKVLGVAQFATSPAGEHLAKDLLRSSELGVAAVADRIGYDSDEAASREFKPETGLASSSWRLPADCGRMKY